MERPPIVHVVIASLLSGCLWYAYRFWTAHGAPPEAGVDSSEWILALLYLCWYGLLVAGFLRMQGWARALFLFVTPMLFAVDLAVQLIEYDPLPPDLLAGFLLYLAFAFALSRRRVAELFT